MEFDYEGLNKRIRSTEDITKVDHAERKGQDVQVDIALFNANLSYVKVIDL